MGENQSKPSINALVPTPSQQINHRMIHNVLLVWLDQLIDNNNPHYLNPIVKLRRLAKRINTFTDSESCIKFIQDIVDDKVWLIISGSFGEHTVPRIHNMSQIDSILIFCGNKSRHEQWAKNWSKIKGVFTDIKPIYEILRHAAKAYEQSSMSFNFVPATATSSQNKNLNHLDPIFIHEQLLKEALFSIRFEDQHIKKFIRYCSNMCADNEDELKDVNELEKKYHQKTPIWWYTSDLFLYPMLNSALQLSEIDVIMNMGFFIGDLHRDIDRLHKEQFNGTKNNKSFIVYRGQGISKDDFKTMNKSKGGLITFRNFLSTNKSADVSLDFAHRALQNPDMVGVQFVMTIDPSKSRTPFASIRDGSANKDENEVLFSLHTVFRIQNIISKGDNTGIFRVDLVLISDNDLDLQRINDHIRNNNFAREGGWFELTSILIKMGHLKKAQQVYETLLKETTDLNESGRIYHQLGWIKNQQGEYNEAIEFYEKSIEIKHKLLRPTHPSLAMSYNNIGNVYCTMGHYWKALSSHKKSLYIWKRSLPSTHPDLALSYNNIGTVFYNMGAYSKALTSYEKSLGIRKQSLPPAHPDLALSYGNIGLMYSNMGQYSKALDHFEKVLEIQNQSLPSIDPYLAASYNNIGNMYYDMDEYSKALMYYEKSLEIKKQIFSSLHLDLAKSYNNIGLVYLNTGEYSKALSYHEKNLEILKQSLPPTHPDLANSYNNIGLVYDNMGEYSEAFANYELAVKIAERAIPSNHPYLEMYYRNLEIVKEKL